MRTILLVSIILTNCSYRSSEERKSHEAIMLHNSMIKKANLIEHRLNELNADSSVCRDSVVQLSNAVSKWKNDLVEVPGNQEHDHENYDDVHGHKEIPDVTEEQMLEIQKELDQRLSRIGLRLQQLKPESNGPEHIH